MIHIQQQLRSTTILLEWLSTKKSVKMTFQVFWSVCSCCVAPASSSGHCSSGYSFSRMILLVFRVFSSFSSKGDDSYSIAEEVRCTDKLCILLSMMCDEQCCNKYCRVRAKRESSRKMTSSSDYTLLDYFLGFLQDTCLPNSLHIYCEQC